jgi:N,N'-diacetyllegionaminate synthase
MSKPITIGAHQIGAPENHCYIIAEAGVNHNGSLAMALELVHAAKAAGADCVKFQTFKAASVVTAAAPKANYQLEVTDRTESQLAMLKKLELPLEHYREIIALCEKLDIEFMSTPYNYADADFLNGLGVNAFKIASGQLVEWDFLDYVARFGKPLIISSGMANLAEVAEGVSAIRKTGNEQIILLQCTTNYPSKLEDANIRAMVSMQQALNLVIGYSDHVPSNYACYAAVALGAKVIEKHFTLDNLLPGPDHSSSLNPADFRELVIGIRSVEKSLGNPLKEPTEAEIKNTKGMRRSIVALAHLPKGTVLQKEHLAFKRPATGIAPKYLELLIGKQVACDIEQDGILQMKDINW